MIGGFKGDTQVGLDKAGVRVPKRMILRGLSYPQPLCNEEPYVIIIVWL